MYMCLHIYAYTYVCVYVCIYIYMYIYVCMYTYICICIYVYICTGVPQPELRGPKLSRLAQAGGSSLTDPDDVNIDR